MPSSDGMDLDVIGKVDDMANEDQTGVYVTNLQRGLLVWGMGVKD